MVTLSLSKRIPERTWRTALKPNEQNLWNVENDVQAGDDDKAASDLRVYDTRSVNKLENLRKKCPCILLCEFISIKNAATATLPVGIARLKKKTVIHVNRRKLCSSPTPCTIVMWFPRPWRTDMIPNIWVRAVKS
jgi:hypothetical protein